MLDFLMLRSMGLRTDEVEFLLGNCRKAISGIEAGIPYPGFTDAQMDELAAVLKELRAKEEAVKHLLRLPA